jgi:hypothetical protein
LFVLSLETFSKNDDYEDKKKQTKDFFFQVQSGFCKDGATFFSNQSKNIHFAVFTPFSVFSLQHAIGNL